MPARLVVSPLQRRQRAVAHVGPGVGRWEPEVATSVGSSCGRAELADDRLLKSRRPRGRTAADDVHEAFATGGTMLREVDIIDAAERGRKRHAERERARAEAEEAAALERAAQRLARKRRDAHAREKLEARIREDAAQKSAFALLERSNEDDETLDAIIETRAARTRATDGELVHAWALEYDACSRGRGQSERDDTGESPRFGNTTLADDEVVQRILRQHEVIKGKVKAGSADLQQLDDAAVSQFLLGVSTASSRKYADAVIIKSLGRRTRLPLAESQASQDDDEALRKLVTISGDEERKSANRDDDAVLSALAVPKRSSVDPPHQDDEAVQRIISEGIACGQVPRAQDNQDDAALSGFLPGEARRDDNDIRCIMAGATSANPFRPECEPRDCKDDTALRLLIGDHETNLFPSSRNLGPTNTMLAQRELRGQTLGVTLSCQDDEAVRLLIQGEATGSTYTDLSRDGDRLNRFMSRGTSYSELQGDQAIRRLITGREDNSVRAARQDDGAVGLLRDSAAAGSRRVAEQGHDEVRRLLTSSQGERHLIQDATMWSPFQAPAGTWSCQTFTQPLAATALRPGGGLVNQLMAGAQGAASRDDELLSQLLHCPPKPVAPVLHSGSFRPGASCGVGGRGAENQDDLMLKGLLDGTWSDPAVDHGVDDLLKLESLIQHNTAQALFVSH